MRDSASFWVLDERGEVGLPRIGIEAVASNWDAHQIQVNVAFADGRVYRLREDGASWPVEGPDGRPTVLGAGPLAFTCVRSVRHLDAVVRRPCRRNNSAEALVAGNTDGPLVDVGLPGGSHHGGAAMDSGHDAGRRRSQPQDIHRRRPDGRAALRAAVPRHRFGAGGGRARTHVWRDGAAHSLARVCAGWRGSGATAGSRPCSPAGKRSATSPIRRAPTASPQYNEGYLYRGDGRPGARLASSRHRG